MHNNINDKRKTWKSELKEMDKQERKLTHPSLKEMDKQERKMTHLSEKGLVAATGMELSASTITFFICKVELEMKLVGAIRWDSVVGGNGEWRVRWGGVFSGCLC